MTRESLDTDTRHRTMTWTTSPYTFQFTTSSPGPFRPTPTIRVPIAPPFRSHVRIPRLGPYRQPRPPPPRTQRRASCLSRSREPNLTADDRSTPHPFSTTGRAAPYRCTADRSLNGSRSSLHQLAPTCSCSARPRRSRHPSRMALTTLTRPARPGLALSFHAVTLPEVLCQDCSGRLPDSRLPGT